MKKQVRVPYPLSPIPYPLSLISHYLSGPGAP